MAVLSAATASRAPFCARIRSSRACAILTSRFSTSVWTAEPALNRSFATRRFSSKLATVSSWTFTNACA